MKISSRSVRLSLPKQMSLLNTARSVSARLSSPFRLPLARYATVTMESKSRASRLVMNQHRNKKQKKSKKQSGFDEVLQADIDQLLKPQTTTTTTTAAAATDETLTELSRRRRSVKQLPERFSEIDVTVSELSSTGDGLALAETGDHVYVVPFTVPGDTVRAKVVSHYPALGYSLTDLVDVLQPGPRRQPLEQIRCRYFGKCSGCQMQMLPYEDQLAHKKRIVEKAYANFSGLNPQLVPPVADTFPSPLRFGYRTKLTPHFRSPAVTGAVPPIGFTIKNRRSEMDIEDCPLGTDVVRLGLKRERQRVIDNIGQYSLGATLLMRESTTRIPKAELPVSGASSSGTSPVDKPAGSDEVVRVEHEEYVDEKQCVTDFNAVTVEYVDNYVFMNKAGDFFQNNNSILPGFTAYIRDHALPPSNSNSSADAKPIKYLLDAYSGSGLFTITLSPLFKSSLGVDVSSNSIEAARANAHANGLYNTGFAAADAADLFHDIPYPADQTLLVIDPPRKGCSEDFLRQLLAYGPRRVIYVSCNVHTQARDVAILVRGESLDDNNNKRVQYEIESLRGFDFFPQTGHVEAVAILNRVSSSLDE